MYDNESLSDAWNDGFEAGLDFAKTMLSDVHGSHQPVKAHDSSCLIYICTCKSKDK